jgi:rhodanese-related sulfurtransferase
VATSSRKTIDDLLAEACARLERLDPPQARAAAAAGALLVDVRSEDDRRRRGGIPGAVHYPLSVVLWRLDPDCPTGNPKPPLDTHVILFCNEGYSSALAAAQLQEIGFARATDLAGGFEAWLAAGLPTAPTS